MAHISQIDYETSSPEIRAAFDEETRLRGTPTNMKRTLLHSVPAHKAYMEWYSLRDVVVPFLGKRAFSVFAYAISSQNDCLLCTTFFRKALIDQGLSPESFEPTADEDLLIAFGRAIARHYDGVDPALWERVHARYSETEIVNLVAFAGLMVATNLFNNVVQVSVDDQLKDYLKA